MISSQNTSSRYRHFTNEQNTEDLDTLTSDTQSFWHRSRATAGCVLLLPLPGSLLPLQLLILWDGVGPQCLPSLSTTSKGRGRQHWAWGHTWTGIKTWADEAGECRVGFIYLPFGHDLGPVVGGMLQTQLTDGADKRPMSVFCVMTRHMLGVSGLAHLCGNNQEHRLMTLLWLQNTE